MSPKRKTESRVKRSCYLKESDDRAIDRAARVRKQKKSVVLDDVLDAGISMLLRRRNRKARK